MALESPGKSQVAICYLRYTGTDPPRSNWTPLGPFASSGRSVRPTLMAKKGCHDPLTEFLGTAQMYKVPYIGPLINLVTPPGGGHCFISGSNSYWYFDRGSPSDHFYLSILNSDH